MLKSTKLVISFTFLCLSILVFMIVLFVSMNFLNRGKRFSPIHPLVNLGSEYYPDHGNLESVVKISHETAVSSVNFGSMNYRCYGSCFCEEKGKRRISSSYTAFPLRGFFYVVSATTSIMVIKKAEEFFSSQCSSLVEEDCETNLVSSEIEECEPINNEDEILSESISELETSSKSEEEEEHDTTTTEFVCTGRCIPYDFTRTNEVMDDVLGQDHTSDVRTLLFQDTLTFTGREIFFFCSNENVLTSKVSVERKGTFETQEEYAINTFRILNLHKFCKSNSIFTLDELEERFFPHDEVYKLGDRVGDIAKDLWRKFFGNFMSKKVSSDGIDICRAKREVYVPNMSDLDRSLAFNTIICLRQFTKEEWEKKIPHQKENWRYWKDGYRMEPDKWKREYVDHEPRYILDF